MITNKDIRVENGFLIINGDKYPLDGQSPEAIMEIVEDNSDSTPTENSTAPVTSGGVFASEKNITDSIGDITQTGVTGSDVASQITTVSEQLKIVEGTATIASITGNTDQTVSVTATIPTGYKAAGIIAASASSRNVAITGTLIGTNSISIFAANMYSVDLTNITVSTSIICVKE